MHGSSIIKEENRQFPYGYKYPRPLGEILGVCSVSVIAVGAQEKTR